VRNRVKHLAMLAVLTLLAVTAGTATWDAGTARASGHVTMPTVLTGFSVSLSQFGQLRYVGCLGLPPGVTSAIPVRVPGVVIQYAASKGGTWRRLGTATLTGHGCGNQGEAFRGSLQAALNLAYYRAYFPGGTGLQATGYAAAHSPTLLAWKFSDRITSLAVSSAKVAKGGRLTVRGTLQYYHFGWHGYGGQQVLVIFRFKGTSTWYYIAQPVTSPHGAFSATFRDPGSATWSAEYLGNSSHLATVGAMIYVRVE
jgi:hypothetical protein